MRKIILLKLHPNLKLKNNKDQDKFIVILNIKLKIQILLSMNKRLDYTTVCVIVFVCSTFDIFNVTCKQCHSTALNPFLNGTENDDFDGTCKLALTRTEYFSDRCCLFLV